MSEIIPLPGGFVQTVGDFVQLISHGGWWTSTAHTSSSSRNRGINFNIDKIASYTDTKVLGFSVRCIKE